MPSNLMGPGTRTERSAADIKAAQVAAQKADAARAAAVAGRGSRRV